jgi:hypothetical protein
MMALNISVDWVTLTVGESGVALQSFAPSFEDVVMISCNKLGEPTPRAGIGVG